MIYGNAPRTILGLFEHLTVSMIRDAAEAKTSKPKPIYMRQEDPKLYRELKKNGLSRYFNYLCFWTGIPCPARKTVQTYIILDMDTLSGKKTIVT